MRKATSETGAPATGVSFIQITLSIESAKAAKNEKRGTIMKKALALLLSSLMLVGALTGCGSKSDASGASGSDSASDGAAEEKSVTLKIHCDYTEDHPASQLLAQFCDRVSEATNGTVTVKPYYAGALGDYTTVFDEVAQGSIDMTWGCNSVTFGEVQNIGKRPYLAVTWDDAKTMFAPESFVSTTMADLCDQNGIKMLGLHLIGAGGLAATKMPKDWETWGVDHDFLLRVPNADTVTLPMSAMGYRTQSVNWSELFTAVQTGVVDGFVGGHPPAVYDQFRDVVKYYLQINNFFEVATISINKNTFEKLSADQQAALEEAAAWAFDESVASGEATENEYLQKMSDYGIEVIKPDESVLQNFAEHCRTEVWPELRSSINNDEVFDGLMASLNIQ